MTWEWKIGDPVDDATGGSMDAQNWGRGFDEEEDDGFKITKRKHNSKIDEYAKKAWECYLDFREEEALHYIDMALNLNDKHANNLNTKAIILEGMKRFEESEKCYDKSLTLNPKNLVYDNRMRMYYRWAVHLREESKNLPDGSDMLKEAYDIAIKAINAFPGENTEEDLKKYLDLRDSINFYIEYEKDFQEKLEKVMKYDKDELFTIVRKGFFNINLKLTPHMPLRLVAEKDNEADRDAIAVYAEGEKIGYVANSRYTKFDESSSASELKGKIQDSANAEYLYYLNRYSKYQFHIARIIK